MLASCTVRDYMCGEKTTFTPDMDVLRAIHVLVERDISGAPVIDQHGSLIGFLSERDCMKVALEAGYQGDAGGHVEDFMTKEVHTVDVDEPIIEVAERFLATSHKRFPVLQNNRLVGAITRRKVLKTLEFLSAPEANAKH